MSHQLLRELRDDIESLTREMPLRDPTVDDETQDGAFIAPRVFLGGLPPKRKQGTDNHDFPFVVLRITGGEDQQNRVTIDVQIVCGVYTAENEEGGVNDLQNLISRIRALLLSKRVFGGVFDLELPLSWTTGTDEERNQPHPYYIGQLTPQFSAVHKADLPEVDVGLDVYGYGLEAD